MGHRYRLGGLGNEQLLAALSGLVKREHDLMSDLLAHLAELDERRLYWDLGFTSLFAYCTEALGFCRSAAGRRIAVARVCRRYPEAFSRVARGELQLSVLSLLGPYLSPENVTELFEVCSRQSCEQVEELLAARFPKPDIRDSIRRLPAQVEVTPAIGTEVDSRPQQRKLEPLSPDRFGVHFTADSEFRELLEEVSALVSHRDANGDLMSVMKRGLEAYRRELQKQRFGVGRKPRRVGSARSWTVLDSVTAGTAVGSEPAKRSRHIPAPVARAVYLRDSGSCTYCSPDGGRCGARRWLELDHVRPWAVGAEHVSENLRLRCRAHNLHAARRYFGACFMRRRLARVRTAHARGLPREASTREEDALRLAGCPRRGRFVGTG